MDNNFVNENEVKNQAKCGTGTKIIFYILGSFCVMLSLFSLLIIFTNLFAYDKQVDGTVTEISKNALFDEYDVVIEYSIDGKKKTETIHLDTVPLGISEYETVKVKYSSKNNMTYIPKFESMSDQIIMFLITATFAAACFMAPHNSKEAANKFLSIRGKVRK